MARIDLLLVSYPTFVGYRPSTAHVSMPKIMTFRLPRLIACCALLIAAAGLHGQEVEPKHLATIEEVLKYDPENPWACRISEILTS